MEETLPSPTSNRSMGVVSRSTSLPYIEKFHNYLITVSLVQLERSGEVSHLNVKQLGYFWCIQYVTLLNEGKGLTVYQVCYDLGRPEEKASFDILSKVLKRNSGIEITTKDTKVGDKSVPTGIIIFPEFSLKVDMKTIQQRPDTLHIEPITFFK